MCLHPSGSPLRANLTTGRTNARRVSRISKSPSVTVVTTRVSLKSQAVLYREKKRRDGAGEIAGQEFFPTHKKG